MHLGDAELLADLSLGHAVVETQDQYLLLAHRQLTPVRGDGLHAEHVLHLRVLSTEKVSQAGRTRPTGKRRVQRGWPEGHVRKLGIPQLVAADPQVPRQVRLGRSAAELLGQLPGRRADFHGQLLDRALDIKLPARVPEMALDLAGDAGLGIGGQAAAEGRIEVVDRLHQADIPHLHQVLSRLRTAPVSLHAGPDQAAVTAHQQLACRIVPLAGQRQRGDDGQQFPVIQPGQAQAHRGCRDGHYPLGFPRCRICENGCHAASAHL